MTSLVTRPLAYEQGSCSFEGMLIYPQTASGKLPGLLMAPNWMGVTEAATALARRQAEKGYVVLLVDLYGKTVRPSNPEQAGAAMMPLRNDRGLLRQRMQAGLEALCAQVDTCPLDAGRLAVFGFCFGGCCALELARSGAEVKAAVSFHGTLDSPTPEDARNIRGAVLVLDGAQDPLVPREHLSQFIEEMTVAGVDWQLTSYGGAVHSFTDVNANVPGTAQYNEKVSCRAFASMDALLKEVFVQS